MMEKTTRTAYAGYLQTCMFFNKAWEMFENTTLNESLGIQAGVQPTAGVYPKLSYWVIGNGAHGMVTGANGNVKPQDKPHRGSDAGLYNQVPFVLRPINDDLSALERTKYALRKQESHGGSSYFAYYARRMDLTNTTPGMFLTTVNDGVSATQPFVPTLSNLKPTPPELDSNGAVVTTGDYLSARAIVEFSMTADEVDEFINAISIIENDTGYAIISEIGICSGVDKSVSSPGYNGNITFNDAIAVQLGFTVNTLHYMPSANNGLSILLDVGTTEPLFSTTNP